MSTRRRPASRLEVALQPHEHIARRFLAVVGAAFGVLLVAGLVVIPIGRSLDSHRCDAAQWPDHIRNSIVYVDTQPVCDGGQWKVTTSRKNMPEDAYGFNCYMDGNGICGPLEPTDKGCVTDTSDGYTMCWDGRVYYRDSSGAKLWPILRAPA